MKTRKQNYENQNILTDWEESFSEVLSFMREKAERY